MRQSQLFTKTLKSISKDEQSVNAQLLERGGFIYKNSAGVYTFLPLGWRVMEKIANVIREEMDAINGQEMFMPALVDKKYLDATGRWNIDVGFKIHDENFVLGWTHEEVLTAIATKFISSYKDLPVACYQIQTKFRNEARAKSGILRGKEFMMKDLYSFHRSAEDLEKYYQEVKAAYFKVFARCGLKAVYTLAAGGDFTANQTHEFQVMTEVGEDTILVCSNCGYAENKEISELKKDDECPNCKGNIEERKAIEVGNLFPLGTKYSEALGLKFAEDDGKQKAVVMGSYGIGLSRVMGTIVEVSHDEKGIIWPTSVAPYQIHLLGLSTDASKVYEALRKAGIEVFYDDRDTSAGVKFADSDLIGIPYRAVVSEKTVSMDKVELKKRSEEKTKLINEKELVKFLISNSSN